MPDYEGTIMQEYGDGFYFSDDLPRHGYSNVYTKWYHLITGSYQIRALAKIAMLPKSAMQSERTCEPKYMKGKELQTGKLVWCLVALSKQLSKHCS